MFKAAKLQILTTILLIAPLAACGQDAPQTQAAQQAEGPQQTEAPQQPLNVGDAAPPWTGVDLDSGKSLTFPDLLNDKPAVLVFWATWCPYCKAFMPYAGEIQADYGDAGVQIVTFNAKERGKGDPVAYVRSLGFPLIAIQDADPIAALYGVKFIPGLMVVDGQGTFRYQRGWTDLPAGATVAEQWDGEVRASLDAILGR